MYSLSVFKWGSDSTVLRLRIFQYCNAALTNYRASDQEGTLLANVLACVMPGNDNGAFEITLVPSHIHIQRIAQKEYYMIY